MSMRTWGAARRSFIMGSRDWPPAMSLASSAGRGRLVEQVEGLVQGAGAGVGEVGGKHVSLLSLSLGGLGGAGVAGGAEGPAGPAWAARRAAATMFW